MTTQFQKDLSADKETLWAIVKLLHPDIPETFIGNKDRVISVKKDRLACNLRYDWICIDFQVRGWGQVAIGIDNSRNYKLYGPHITKKQMAASLLDGTTTMNVWRFVNDKGHDPDHIIESKPEEPGIIAAVKLLYDRGYKLQSADEMYEIYYEE